MHLFLLGDFVSSTGPGIANRQIKESLELKYNVNVLSNSKLDLLLNLYNQIKKNDVLIICSYSKVDYIAIKIAKILRKKIVYIMHGCVTYEKKMNNPSISSKKFKKIDKFENYIFENVDKIICVSKHFMNFMIEYKSVYKNKYDYIFNVVNVEKSNELIEKKIQVFSTGGGMIRKNNYKIACSIEKAKLNLQYIIAGNELEDGYRLRGKKCVKWMDAISHDDVIKLMSESSLYVQNSKFETFGIAVIEALYCGCDILISNNVGCKDLFSNLTNDDIIFDEDNEEQIGDKIKKLIKYGNNNRLMDGFLKEYISQQWQANKIQKIIGELIDVNNNYTNI